MAYKREVVGSFVKSKDATKPPYIKVRSNVTLKAGSFLNVESKKYRKESIGRAIENGKLSEEVGNKMLEQVEKTPDWVLGDVILVSRD